MDTPKFYVAHALVFDEDNRLTTMVFCGLFKDRTNAYKNVKNTMSSYPGAHYIPIVKLGEVLDEFPPEHWDWPMPEIPIAK